MVSSCSLSWFIRPIMGMGSSILLAQSVLTLLILAVCSPTSRSLPCAKRNKQANVESAGCCSSGVARDHRTPRFKCMPSNSPLTWVISAWLARSSAARFMNVDRFEFARLLSCIRAVLHQALRLLAETTPEGGGGGLAEDWGRRV